MIQKQSIIIFFFLTLGYNQICFGQVDKIGQKLDKQPSKQGAWINLGHGWSDFGGALAVNLAYRNKSKLISARYIKLFDQNNTALRIGDIGVLVGYS